MLRSEQIQDHLHKQLLHSKADFLRGTMNILFGEKKTHVSLLAEPSEVFISQMPTFTIVNQQQDKSFSGSTSSQMHLSASVQHAHVAASPEVDGFSSYSIWVFWGNSVYNHSFVFPEYLSLCVWLKCLVCRHVALTLPQLLPRKLSPLPPLGLLHFTLHRSESAWVQPYPVSMGPHKARMAFQCQTHHSHSLEAK